MNAKEREELRQSISAARRASVGTTCPNGYGPGQRYSHTSGYRRGCRCRACCDATTAKRQQRRERAGAK